MSKHLLCGALLALAVCGANVQAQDLTNHTLYDFGNFVWDDADGITNSVLPGVFNKVSANGNYAVGYDDQLLFTTFMWTSDYPDILELINTNGNIHIYLADVTDDGTAVGGYESADGAGMYPAVRNTDGTWTMLPLPENTSSRAAIGMQDDLARAVTPSGSHIAGQVYIITGMTTSPLDGSESEVRALMPCLWTKTDTGYVVNAMTNLGAAGQSYIYNEATQAFDVVETEVEAKTFYIYDISEDGSTIIGMNTAANGAQNPMFIRDGKLYQLFDCASEANESFNGGVCSNIDAAGNIYGYFADGDFVTKFFVFTADGKLEYTDDWYICGDAQGNRYLQNNVGMPYTMSCSNDGRTIVGGGVKSSEMGTFNSPAVLYNPNPTAIDNATQDKSNIGIRLNGTVLNINGDYSRAEVYNLDGALIAAGTQGFALDMAGKASGAVVVKVTTATGIRTFKVLR